MVKQKKINIKSKDRRLSRGLSRWNGILVNVSFITIIRVTKMLSIPVILSVLINGMMANMQIPINDQII